MISHHGGPPIVAAVGSGCTAVGRVMAEETHRAGRTGSWRPF